MAYFFYSFLSDRGALKKAAPTRQVDAALGSPEKAFREYFTPNGSAPGG